MSAAKATCLFALFHHVSALAPVLPSDLDATLKTGDLSGLHLHITTIHDSTAMNMLDANGDMLPWQQWKGFQRDVIDWVSRKAGFTPARKCKAPSWQGRRRGDARAALPGLLGKMPELFVAKRPNGRSVMLADSPSMPGLLLAGSPSIHQRASGIGALRTKTVRCFRAHITSACTTAGATMFTVTVSTTAMAPWCLPRTARTYSGPRPTSRRAATVSNQRPHAQRRQPRSSES